MIAALALFMPRWLRPLSLRQAYSVHNVLRGEHGLDRFAFVAILLIVYGFLIYLTVALAPLFCPGVTYWWGGGIGLLLLIPAVMLFPRKRPPSDWHQ